MAKRIPADKPIAVLRAVARRLGWSPLRWYQQVLPEQETRAEQCISWYESGVARGTRQDCFLQINEHPIGQTDNYAIAVYAIRYRLCTGWHSLRLTDDEPLLQRELARIEPWVHHRWFETALGRRQFRQQHPECAGYSWTRIREHGPPYRVGDEGNGR